MEMFAGREYKVDRKTFEQDGISNDEINLCIHRGVVSCVRNTSQQ